MFEKVTKNTFIKSFLFNGLILLFFYLLFYCKFEVNDDFAMKKIASGFYGEPDVHLIYINTVIGYILKFFYTFIPKIVWYDLFQYFVIFISLTVISYVLTQEKSNIYGLIVYVVIFTSAYYLYSELQFTKVASICAAAGYLLLEFGIRKNKLSFLIISVFLIVSGYCIRRIQFFATSMLSVTVFVPTILSFIKNPKSKKEQRGILKLFICGLICVLLVCVAHSINQRDYSDDSWAYFKKYNNVRSKLLDMYHLDYNEDPTFYESIGLCEIDINMLYDMWCFDDTDVFDYETFYKISEHQGNVSFDVVSAIKELIFESVEFFFKDDLVTFYSFLYIILFCFLILSCINKNQWNAREGLLTSVVLLFTLIFAYFYRGLRYVPRVHLTLLIVGNILLLKLIEIPECNVSKTRILICVILIVGCFSSMHSDNLRFMSQDKQKDYRKSEALHEIQEDGEHLYLHAADENLYYVSGVGRGVEINTANLISLGGWSTNTPLKQDALKNYDVNNCFRDIIDNDKVYLIIYDEDKLNTIMKYIHVHYDDTAKEEYVKTIEANKPYKVYKIVSSGNLDAE